MVQRAQSKERGNPSKEPPGSMSRAMVDVMAGAVAGGISRSITAPLDVIKIRFQVQLEPTSTRYWNGLANQHHPSKYTGILQATRDIVREEGIKALNSRKTLQGSTEKSLSKVQLSTCGLAAGTIAKIVCHPLDVVKKRFQVEGLRRHPRYGANVELSAQRNVWRVTKRILQDEGVAGLYKGLYPSLVKAAPASAITFVVYELVSEWLQSFVT